jgi:hypothetical protein
MTFGNGAGRIRESRNAVSACIKAVGIVLPRFSARLNIPAAAFGESKNLFGNVRLRTAGNDEDPPASLGNIEELAVQHSPCWLSKPEVGQRTENDGEIPAIIGTEQSGNILKDKKSSRSNNPVCDSHCVIKQSTPFSCKTGSFASHA